MTKTFLDWLRSDLRAALSLGFLLLLAVLALAAPLIAPYGPTVQDLNNTLAEPSALHPMGTDDLGRDVLSRLIHGAPVTLYASFLAVGIAIAIGLPVGLLAGFLGGWVDDAISRFIDALLSFPAIVLAIAVTGALGIGLTNGMISVGIVFSPQIARLVRARTLVVRGELYVDAARCFGGSTARILWRHVLPNTIAPLIVQATFIAGSAILLEAALSFLGVGMPPEVPTWGNIMAEGRTLFQVFPHNILYPGIFLTLTVLAINMLGDGLRDTIDPRMSKKL